MASFILRCNRIYSANSTRSTTSCFLRLIILSQYWIFKTCGRQSGSKEPACDCRVQGGNLQGLRFGYRGLWESLGKDTDTVPRLQGSNTSLDAFRRRIYERCYKRLPCSVFFLKKDKKKRETFIECFPLLNF